MSRVNIPPASSQVRTHEGGPAETLDPVRALRRSVLTCLLWDDTFYEKGSEIALRIAHLVSRVDAAVVRDLAVELPKYDRANTVRLRDVLFLVHAKPKDEEQTALWKRLVDGQMATPDTWEVALSAGEDKKETFEREKAEQVSMATFSEQVVIVPPRRGFALRDAIRESQPHQGTYLRRALELLRDGGYETGWHDLDRVVVITDEQSHDGILPAFTNLAYVVNVAPYRHGISYSEGWTHIDGWSERVVDYIREVEAEDTERLASVAPSSGA
jgi:hypothetical protein